LAHRALHAIALGVVRLLASWAYLLTPHMRESIWQDRGEACYGTGCTDSSNGARGKTHLASAAIGVVAPATVAHAQARGAADAAEAAGGAAPRRLAVGGRRALGARDAPELHGGDEQCREQQSVPLQRPPRHGVAVRIGVAEAGADHHYAEAGARCCRDDRMVHGREDLADGHPMKARAAAATAPPSGGRPRLDRSPVCQ
jgi:hypothetical protein